MADGGEGFLVGGDRPGVRAAAEGAGVRGLAVQGGGGAGADQLGGGQPGPGFLDGQARGPGPQHRAGRAVPRPGDRGLVFPERGLRRAPPGQVRLPDRVRGRGLVVQQRGDQGAGLGDFLAVAAGQDRVVLGGADRRAGLLSSRTGRSARSYGIRRAASRRRAPPAG